ncbi:MAG TPA: hypothetical protein VF152_09165 [Acidimicrobiia bacterium]
MAKDLVVGSAGGSETWRLPSEYDAEALRTDLEEAFAKGTYVWIAVEAGEHGVRGELILNGRVTQYAAIVERPEEPSPRW